MRHDFIARRTKKIEVLSVFLVTLKGFWPYLCQDLPSDFGQPVWGNLGDIGMPKRSVMEEENRKKTARQLKVRSVSADRVRESVHVTDGTNLSENSTKPDSSETR